VAEGLLYVLGRVGERAEIGIGQVDARDVDNDVEGLQRACVAESSERRRITAALLSLSGVPESVATPTFLPCPQSGSSVQDQAVDILTVASGVDGVAHR
jgi:hypothetical protein